MDRVDYLINTLRKVKYVTTLNLTNRYQQLPNAGGIEAPDCFRHSPSEKLFD